MFTNSEDYLIPITNDFKKSFQSLSLPFKCNQCWCPSYLEINLLKSLKFKGIIEMAKSLNNSKTKKLAA